MELPITDVILFGIIFGFTYAISSKICEEIHNYVDKRRKIKKLKDAGITISKKELEEFMGISKRK